MVGCADFTSAAQGTRVVAPHMLPWKMNGWLNLQNSQKMKLKVNHLNQPPPFCGFNMLIFINFPGCRTSRCAFDIGAFPSQSSSDHQDDETFLGSGIPNQTFI